MRARLRKLALTKRRGSITMEGVLTLPVTLVLFGAVAQVLVTSQGRMFVEQAAYAAARSALVHMCRPTEPFCTENPGKWEDAARWALVPAAATQGGASCPTITAGQQILTADNRIAGRDTAAFNALCYAFDPANTDVTVEWVYASRASLTGPDNFPVRATVKFKLPLTSPFKKFVADGETNGVSWRWGEATVVLL